jgi:hypothetical protein
VVAGDSTERPKETIHQDRSEKMTRLELVDYGIWKLNGTYQLELWTTKGLEIHITKTKQEATDLIKLKTGVQL